jgi:AcrR family transcriptional regulator
MSEKEDLRVIKTKNNIERTFLDLLKEMSFEKVTVRLILEKALISKGTFYSHYLDKYDLAEKVVNQYLSQFRSGVAKRLEGILNHESYDVLWSSLHGSMSTIIEDIRVLKKLHIDVIDIETSIKNILKEEYVIYAEAQGILTKNISLQSAIIASLAMEYITYIQEHGEMVEMSEYIQSVYEISYQYLSYLEQTKKPL